MPPLQSRKGSTYDYHSRNCNRNLCHDHRNLRHRRICEVSQKVSELGGRKASVLSFLDVKRLNKGIDKSLIICYNIDTKEREVHKNGKSNLL